MIVESTLLAIFILAAILPYELKTQYLQISNIIDTSIKRPISGQSTPMVKDCVGICLIW